ncbi:uncharacterized protein LOC143462082 [Clavelina lepadiformis]
MHNKEINQIKMQTFSKDVKKQIKAAWPKWPKENSEMISLMWNKRKSKECSIKAPAKIKPMFKENPDNFDISSNNELMDWTIDMTSAATTPSVFTKESSMETLCRNNEIVGLASSADYLELDESLNSLEQTNKSRLSGRASQTSSGNMLDSFVVSGETFISEDNLNDDETQWSFVSQSHLHSQSDCMTPTFDEHQTSGSSLDSEDNDLSYVTCARNVQKLQNGYIATDHCNIQANMEAAVSCIQNNEIGDHTPGSVARELKMTDVNERNTQVDNILKTHSYILSGANDAYPGDNNSIHRHLSESDNDNSDVVNSRPDIEKNSNITFKVSTKSDVHSHSRLKLDVTKKSFADVVAVNCLTTSDTDKKIKVSEKRGENKSETPTILNSECAKLTATEDKNTEIDDIDSNPTSQTDCTTNTSINLAVKIAEHSFEQHEAKHGRDTSCHMNLQDTLRGLPDTTPVMERNRQKITDMEDLHCSVMPHQIPSTPSSSAGRRVKPKKSGIRRLLSRQNTASAKSDNSDNKIKSGKDGDKKRGLQLLFDKPYKATLLRKEVNIGRRVHMERKEREDTLGVPCIVPINKNGQTQQKAFQRPSSKDSTVSYSKPRPIRPRRSSILEFLQSKFLWERNPSTKPKEEMQNEACTKLQTDCNLKLCQNGCDELEDFETYENFGLLSEKKPLHEKYTCRLGAPATGQPQTSTNTKNCKESSFYATNQINVTQRKQRRNNTASPIPDTDAYNTLDRSPLKRRIEELQALQGLKQKVKPILLNKIELNTSDYEGEISDEKTYKKTVPAMLRFTRRIAPKVRLPAWQVQLQKDAAFAKTSQPFAKDATAQCSPIYLDTDCFACTKNNLTKSTSTSYRASHSSRVNSALKFSMEGQMEFDSTDEQSENAQIIKWSNKLGNMFEVTSENGKYGKISCSKDLTSMPMQAPSQKFNMERNGGITKSTLDSRKELTKRAWKRLTDTKVAKSEEKSSKITLQESNQRLQNNTIKEKLVVIYANGRGSNIGFKC